MWPRDAQCAVAFTFDFDAEEVWIADDAENAARPGVLSQGTYDAKVAVPLILGLLAKEEVRATFFVPGRVAERYPDRVREIIAAEHEIGHHGYTHMSPSRLSREQEEAELRRGRDALEALGAVVSGYRSPSWEFSPNTLALLEQNHFEYSSNLMDDIRPYRHPASTIVELPVHWILDDAPHFWFADDSWTKKIATVDEVRLLSGWLSSRASASSAGPACSPCTRSSSGDRGASVCFGRCCTM